MSAKPNRRVKGGAEKAQLKRNADLQAAANNPKQLKFCFPFTLNNILVQPVIIINYTYIYFY